MSTASRTRPQLPWMLAFLLALGFAYAASCLDLINIHIDDVFITLRYSQNMLDGYGPVYNPGQAVEGYSSPTWLFLVTAISALTGFTNSYQLYITSKVVCLIFGSLTLVTLYRIAKIRKNDTPAIVFILVAVAISPFLNTYNIAGMETPFVIFLVTLTFYYYLSWLKTTSLTSALKFAITLAILCISRPEGAIYPVAIFAGLFILQFQKRRQPLPYFYQTLVIVVAIFGAFVIFRLHYYGEYFPNTLYAKNSPSLATFRNGTFYAATFLLVAVAPYAPILLWKRPKISHEYTPIYSAVAAQISFVIYSGGDWMPSFRFMLPVLPIIYFLLADQVKFPQLPMRKLAAVIAIGSLAVIGSTVAQRHYIKNYQDYTSGMHLEIEKYEPDFYEISQHLTLISQPGDRILIAQAGLIPYLNENRRFNDLFGLTDKHMSKDLKGAHGGRVDNDYFFAGDYKYVVYAIAKSLPDINWADSAQPHNTGFYPVDSFINDRRFNERYVPVFKGSRGAIFELIT